MPRRVALLKGALAAVLPLVLAGCPLTPASARFPCNIDADCALDSTCVDGLCRGGKLPDAGPPVVDSGRPDAGGPVDAGPPDAGADASVPVDAAIPPDVAGERDGGGDGGDGGDAGDELDGGADVDSGSDGGDPIDAAEDDAGDLSDGGEAGSDAGPALPAPKHHWRFDETVGSALVLDTVGNAHGVARGVLSAGTGALELDGEDAYVDLPNGIISVLQNATFEVWLRWHGPDDDHWARVFDFGTNSSGEVATPGGGFDGATHPYLFLTPTNSLTQQTRFGITVNGNQPGAEQTVDAPRIPADGSLVHVVVVFDGDGDLAHLYTDGILRGTTTVTIDLDQIPDHNNWLGRSNWSVDPYFDGVLEDFRIYDVALTTAQVEASYNAGVP